jgi:hypothetical protein
MVDTSVIVINWNGRQYLQACLDAVASQQGVEFETLVVDNGSTDGSVEFLRTQFPAVRVVALAANLGFAGGNNAGAREARSERTGTKSPCAGSYASTSPVSML